MRLAVLSASAYAGDAVGNLIARRLAFFLDRGADVRVLVEDDRRLHPGVRPWCHAVSDPAPRGPAWDFLASADLVWVDFTHHFQLLDLLPLLAERGVRVVFNYHGVTPPRLWGRHNREAIQRGARSRGLVACADAALVHSRFAARELLGPTRFPPHRVAQLAHPVDAGRLATSPATDLRRRLGLGEKHILLFVGRLAPNKRLPVLVEALARLRARQPAVHAVVVGDDGDVYRAEADLCRSRAAELGVAERLHLLGHVSDDELHAAYHAADVFVMPSLHEGFCIPVLEAMASGVPVVAARAAALPETVGSAGLTFIPDDAADLARQVARVLDSATGAAPAPPRRLRVAVVVERYGADFVGGAEASLRRMAEALHAEGHRVEVFTTAGPAEGPAGGLPVHPFSADPRDAGRQAAALQRIEQGAAPEDGGREFLAHAVRSSALVDALRSRIGEYDAVVTGPYQSGLALDVARAFPAKTVLVPCFHDEPAARLESLLAVCRGAGGVLYHSPEEQALAEAELGVNCAGAVCIGAVIDAEGCGDPERGRRLVGTGRRYLLFCGRYTAHKELPRLIEYARRYTESRPGRFAFAFTGQGELPIPREPWARDLGFVDPAALRDVVAGAAALVQLSRRESLSLAALEAWAQGTPVIADAGCPVLAGHVGRGQGGRLVTIFEEFAAALDDLWERPQQWQEMGRRGNEYLRGHFGSPEPFLAGLEEAIRGLAVPLAERMRRQGRRRAEEHGPARWRERLASLVEQWLHAPARPYRAALEIQPRERDRTVAAGAAAALLSVRVVNCGTHAVVPDGPARVVLRARVGGEGGPEGETALPDLLAPGAVLPVAVRVPVPEAPGAYDVVLSAGRAGEPGPLECAEVRVRLTVLQRERPGTAPPGAALLDVAREALASAERLRTLPDDYLDVTEGWFAPWKRWLKRKLLNNFKRAYVDVVVRQQSAFNQHVLTALNELAECCAAQQQALEAAVARAPDGARRDKPSTSTEVQLPQEEVPES